MENMQYKSRNKIMSNISRQLARLAQLVER